MKRTILATAWVGAALSGMVIPAAAAPGQCTVTGYGTFDCDVAVDGGGLTFSLPDGGIFAFTTEEDGKGSAFLIDADAKPGQVPDELRNFSAVEGKAGCWARSEDFEFCVLVQQ